MKKNMVAWFEIPVTDMNRAKAFYEKVFDVAVNIQDLGELFMGFFPMNEGASGAMGALMQYKSYTPTHEGVLIYFSCEDLQTELNRIISAGGKILQEKTQISPENGFMGMFEDSEGNRIALHSNK